jgi:hypothetical protein
VTAARELAPGLWHWQAPHPESAPVLQREVGLVLPAHGAPTDRAALERALV